MKPKTPYIGRGGSYPNSGRKLQGDSKRVTISICIESKLLEILDAMAANQKKSRSDIINEIFRENLIDCDGDQIPLI
ncbi:MAG: ribbon-helix-helix domain-containing protein [Planktothrix sp.]